MQIRKSTKFIILFLIMLLISTVAFANNSINVEIANESINFNHLDNGKPIGEPYADNGRTYIPVELYQKI